MGILARVLGRPKLAMPLGLRPTLNDHVVASSGNFRHLTATSILLLPGSMLTLHFDYAALLGLSSTNPQGSARTASRKQSVAAGAVLDFSLQPGEPHGLLIEQLEPRHLFARRPRI